MSNSYGKADVKLKATRSFLSIAKSLLGENLFHGLALEPKAEALEGRAPNNPTGAHSPTEISSLRRFATKALNTRLEKCYGSAIERRS